MVIEDYMAFVRQLHAPVIVLHLGRILFEARLAKWRKMMRFGISI